MKKNISIAFIVWLLSMPFLFAQKTTIPDSNFEKYLETHNKDGVGVPLGDPTSMGDGIDDNNFVFTDRIAPVVSLNISSLNITSLVGLQDFAILETLNFSNNRVAGALSIQNTTLKDLLCVSNELTGLDISASSLLTALNCSSNQLATLVVSSNTLLETLICSDNQLTTIDISNNLELVFLGVSNNQLPTLGVSSNTLLETLICSDNQLTTIDISNNLELVSLGVSNNQLPILNVSNNSKLINLICADNVLTTLTLSATNNEKLKVIDVSNNLLTNLDLSKIGTYQCPPPPVPVENEPPVDVELCLEKISINVSGNQLTSLNIKNGFNTNISLFNAQNNPKLYCIQVDDAFVPNGGLTGWLKDNLAFYNSTLCPNLTYVPDDAFETYLEANAMGDGIANNNFVLTANIESVLSINVIGKSIAYLTGIEDFISLQNLNCSANSLTSLDLSKNIALTTLNCSANSLTSLSLVSNTALTTLDCSNNALTNFKLGNNNVLGTLNCASNSLTSLDVSKNTAITSIDCSNNTLYNLNLGSNGVLTTLDCSLNFLMSLDASKNTAIISLDCSSNALTSLNLGSNSVLTTLDCSTNLLVSLNMSKNLGLTSVNCSNNNLTSLKLGSNIVLTTLDCSINSLISLNVSKNTALTEIYCSNNVLTSLNLDSNTALQIVDCSTNALTSLDLSNNTVLTTLNLASNSLLKLNVKNGNNTDILSFDATTNPNLLCIDVDVVLWSDTNWTNIDGASSFSTNCNTTYVPDDAFEAYLEIHDKDGVVVSLGDPTSMGDGIDNNNFVSTDKIAIVTVLDISSQAISDLTGIEDFTALLDLNCSDNSIVSLDLTSNVVLTTLDCSSNSLVILNISTNSAIISNTSGTIYFDATSNSNLSCINVNSSVVIETDGSVNGWLKDATASYNLNCNTTYVPDNAFEAYLETHDKDGFVVSLGDPTSMGDGILNNNFVSTDKISIVTVLDISGLNISDLTGIEDFSSLQDLNCSTNSLTYLDLSSNTTLTTLNCATNQINNLNISGNTALVTIDCSNNLLTGLDFGGSINLTSLTCNNNLLNALNIKNGQNASLTVFNATSNPDLYCIEVDNAFAPSGGIGWQKDAITLYSLENCANRITVLVDPAFERTLIDLGYDSIEDFEVLTANIEGIKTLDVSHKNIFNLTGIEDFRSLNELNCGGNNLATLNVTQNINLVELLCDSNNLTLASLDLSQNTLLERLNCNSNNLTSLDVTANINLQKLVSASNKLTAINGINNKSNLTDLDCSNNYLPILSISGNTELVNVDCSNNSLIGLSTTDNIKLKVLSCDQNQIVNLGLNTNILLSKLNVSSNKLGSLVSLDLSNNMALDTLNLSKNKISTISLATNTNLISLNISKNKLTSLLLNSNNLLKYINISDNLLTSLNLSDTPSYLITLICNKNSLNEIGLIGLANNAKIKELNISANQFTVIDLNSLIDLEKFYANSNQFTDLDLNSNTELTNVNVSENSLFELKIRNSNNTNLVEFNTLKNPDLRCIEVDDAFASVGKPSWTKDGIASFSENCRYNITDVPDANFEYYLETHNKDGNVVALGDSESMGDGDATNMIVPTDRIRNVITLDISGLGIADLTGIEDFIKLEALDCSDNSITDLVLERNTELTTLNCSTNSLLTSLDLENNINLSTLICTDNSLLTNFDLSKNLLLTTINCANNALTSLNVDSNTLLISLDCSMNQITNLNTSSNSALTTLICNDNNLSSLNLTNNIAIEELDISSNQLVEIDVTELTNLKDINGSSNMITDLNFSLNPLLTAVNFDSNQLITLNIKNGNHTAITLFNAMNNPNLTCIEVDNPTFSNGATGWVIEAPSEYRIECHYGEFYVPDDAFEQALISLGFDSGPLDDYVPTGSISTEISLSLYNKGITDLTGISQFTNLVILDIRNNNLGTLDLSGNLLLETLKCSGNQLASINVSANTQLRVLDVSNNILDNLNVSANSNLNELNCSYNQLMSLEVNSTLEILDCSHNQLINLDFSTANNLTDLDSSFNQLFDFNIKNGNNPSLLNLDIHNNPGLLCILVDDINLARSYIAWIKDSTAFYKLECIDDDNDGVPNELDDCKNTPFGAVVDVFGCQYFSLPASNFTVLITGESCITSNNGKINIVAEETLNYTATFVGVSLTFMNTYKFTKDLDIFNLRSGAYELCITIDDEPSYRICYDINISQPQEFFVSSKVSHSEKKVSLELSGGTTYTINFNGLIFNTTESELSLSLSDGANEIEVKTDLECQGAHKETIFLYNDVSIYPNPFENFINIFTGNNASEKFDINIYSNLGQLVMSKPQSVEEDIVTLDTSSLPKGIYFVSLKSDKSLLTFKIIKK